MNMPFQMKKMLQDYMPLTIFVSVLFIMGVIFGALLVNALSLEQKKEMFQYLGSFLNSVDHGEPFDSAASFKQVFGMHLKWVLLIWILGLSVIGLPVILILDFLKGVLVGFTIGFLVSQWSWKGMLFALVTVAPQNLIIIPSLVLSSVLAIVFSIFMIRNRLIEKKGSMSSMLMQYSIGILGFATLLLGASLFEAFISPLLMKWITPYMTSVG